ncbi:nicotinamide mononucleotide transporter PnuC [Capnocytophaga sp. oral taxon 332 str. F0381]|uniref:nicotinamide riboside transporter PnuC n=1 Tax=Capnocytophaga sp. oral taxon 332 TaxID=712213 RepID=UPI0002A42411|nr:nicotinamide riboside transporter PnuC [Capnocytophaga sp. oral taxon 332]EKY11920.1 nicotinamide mononucleotide transporter PnuC [Capnocytophaga sp. oral taxon 332 str. F0381]
MFNQYDGVPTHLVVLEIIGVIFGFLSVWYARKGNIWVYPTGIISTMLFVYLLWHYVLWGDMLINVYYTIMSIYGWVLWARNAQDNIITISRTTPADWKTAALLGAFSFLFVIGVYYLKPFIKNNFSLQGVTLGFHNFLPTEYVDVFTTAIFLVGMWLMAKRKIENWLFWIVGDLISIPLYYIKGMVFTSFQYLLFTIIAIMGYLEWRRKLQQELMSLSK